MKYKELIEAHGLTLHGDIEHFAELVAAQEREACAALVEANAMACHSTIYVSLLQSNAEAIRARGTT